MEVVGLMFGDRQPLMKSFLDTNSWDYKERIILRVHLASQNISFHAGKLRLGRAFLVIPLGKGPLPLLLRRGAVGTWQTYSPALHLSCYCRMS